MEGHSKEPSLAGPVHGAARDLHHKRNWDYSSANTLTWWDVTLADRISQKIAVSPTNPWIGVSARSGLDKPLFMVWKPSRV